MPSDDEFPPLPEWRWQGAPVRYPDPAVRSLDPRFEELRVDSAHVERLATGCRWAEGPVWFGDHDCLVWSDIPNNRMLRWDARSGDVTTFRSPSHFANGNTRDREGRLVTCEHWTRRVTRTEHDGSVTVLLDAYEGKRLNAPNDVVVRSDGSVWFTDPGYGTLSDYEGERGEHELETAVYLLDPASGAAQAVITELERPNGLCFSPDESTLYVVNSGGAGTISAYPVDPDGTVSHGRVFADLNPGGPGRHPLRRARQSLGGGLRRRRRLRRRPRLRARRHAHRPDPAARGVRQPDLRRPPRHAPVHGREPVDLQRLRARSRAGLSGGRARRGRRPARARRRARRDDGRRAARAAGRLGRRP